MKLVQQEILQYQEGASDKVYEVDLCHLGGIDYVVNFRYGRRGTALKEGTKTVLPVILTVAESVFGKLVQSKVKKGYKIVKDSPVSTLNSIELELVRDELILSYLQAAIIDKYDASNWPLSRVIWRAGELKLLQKSSSSKPKKVVDLLKKLALKIYESINYPYARNSQYFEQDKEAELGFYAAIWALGRIGTPAAISALNGMDTSKVAIAGRIHRAAMVKGKDFYAIVYEEQQLESSIISYYQAKKYQELQELLNNFIHLQKKENNDYLFSLYLLSWKDDALRTVLINIITSLPLAPNYWNQIRYIFKAAEMAEDVSMLGLIASKVERAKPFFGIPKWYDKVYLEGQLVVYKNELKSPKSRLAFSNKTQAFFIRRVLRQLAKAGLAKKELYCQLATNILLYSTDEDYRQHPPLLAWDWSEGTGYTQRTAYYHPLTHLVYLPYIILTNSNRLERNSSGNIFFKDQQDESNDREEAFSELWDQHPKYLLQLLEHSNCKDVLFFAVKAIRNRADLADLITLPIVIHLLQKDYDWALELALKMAKVNYDPQNPNVELLLALIRTNNTEARDLALKWMDENLVFYTQNMPLLVDLMLMQQQPIINWVKLQIQEANYTQQQAKELVDNVLASLLAENAELPPAISELLEITFPKAIANLSFEKILELVQHANPALREWGIKRFGQLPIAVLIEHKDLIKTLCISPHSNLRQLVQPVVKLLIVEEESFAIDLLDYLIPLLLQKETQEGLHEDVYQLILANLESKLESLKDKMMTFVNAPFVAANQIGIYLLKQFADLNKWDLQEVVALGNREMLAFRTLCFDYYNKEKGKIRYEREVALTLLDSDWEDSREFAFEYFETHYSSTDWTADLLIAVCDNVREDVQAFGRKMLIKHFQEEDGELYLLRLSQHPNTELQLYTTNYLERYASANLVRLKELRHYFTVVLVQVNKGKTAKERIYKFLENQAMLGEDYAEYIAGVLNEVVLTISIIDKAKCILILNKIRNAFPAVENAIHPIKYESK